MDVVVVDDGTFDTVRVTFEPLGTCVRPRGLCVHTSPLGLLQEAGIASYWSPEFDQQRLRITQCESDDDRNKNLSRDSVFPSRH